MGTLVAALSEVHPDTWYGMGTLVAALSEVHPDTWYGMGTLVAALSEVHPDTWYGMGTQVQPCLKYILIPGMVWEHRFSLVYEALFYSLCVVPNSVADHGTGLSPPLSPSLPYPLPSPIPFPPLSPPLPYPLPYPLPSRVDTDSPLSEDMKKLKETEDLDHILLHMVFDDKFPYTPPFMRIVKPVINGGYVLAGGAICMELLTPQVSMYTALSQGLGTRSRNEGLGIWFPRLGVMCVGTRWLV